MKFSSKRSYFSSIFGLYITGLPCTRETLLRIYSCSQSPLSPLALACEMCELSQPAMSLSLTQTLARVGSWAWNETSSSSLLKYVFLSFFAGVLSLDGPIYPISGWVYVLKLPRISSEKYLIPMLAHAHAHAAYPSCGSFRVSGNYRPEVAEKSEF